MVCSGGGALCGGLQAAETADQRCTEHRGQGSPSAEQEDTATQWPRQWQRQVHTQNTRGKTLYPAQSCGCG